jgi:hypothetical protein
LCLWRMVGCITKGYQPQCVIIFTLSKENLDEFYETYDTH